MKTIGLDFGTTNTRMSWAGTPWRYPHTGNGLLPSAVAYLPSGKTVVGQQALDRLPIDPANVVLGSKRLLGSRYASSISKQYSDSYTTPLVDNNGSVAVSTRAGVKAPEEICVEIIDEIVRTAGVTPESTTIALTVPVVFDDRQQQGLINACRKIGFSRIHLLEEPVATAVSYLGRCNVRRSAVFDLGGGTFDFAVLGYNGADNSIEVLATGGDDALGGENVDRKLAVWAAERILGLTGWDLKNEKNVFAQVIAASERAKIALGQREQVCIDLSAVDDAAPFSLPALEISRSFLFDLSFPLIQKMFRICDEVLHESKTSPRDVDAVFMSGGGSLMWGIAKATNQYFNIPARTDIDPSFVVSIGAGLAMARPTLHSLLSE